MPEAEAGAPYKAIAASAYRAYAASTNWKNFRGELMPQFNALPQNIQIAWEATVRHLETVYSLGGTGEWIRKCLRLDGTEHRQALGRFESAWADWKPPEEEVQEKDDK